MIITKTPTLRSEHGEQVCVIDWCRRMEAQHPELKLLYAIPNGAALTWKEDRKGRRYSPQAARLKAEGLRPGIPDLCLPLARHGWSALYLEMKSQDGRLSPDQVEMIDLLCIHNNRVEVCYSAEEAIEMIEWYLFQ